MLRWELFSVTTLYRLLFYIALGKNLTANFLLDISLAAASCINSLLDKVAVVRYWFISIATAQW